MELIKKYFPNLTEKQIDQFSQLQALYTEWNEKVNLISRKDIENLYERHILHSLGIAKVFKFGPNTDILDVGTGGGFPGIPLAILFPEANFHLIDSIGKKILVVKNVSEALGLTNVVAENIRAENIKGKKYDYVVSRAVAHLKEFYPWVRNKFKNQGVAATKAGILFLKGGDLDAEIKESKLKRIRVHSLEKFFEEEFFETKKVIYIPRQ
ncbi:MAG: 16S rRNA (guanine527-N7)-methyltransferase [Roseivirga sp.]|jgi:16S rRNA (guanine527-N7)-methyltransferase